MKPSKVGDFFIGMLAVLLAYPVAFGMASGAGPDGGKAVAALAVVGALLAIGLSLRSRPYLALGLTVGIVVPPLAVYACFVAVMH